MKHPYREKAELLRDMVRLEGRDKWADREKISRLQEEARELERLAHIDTIAERITLCGP